MARSALEFSPRRLESLWSLSHLTELVLEGSRRGNTHVMTLQDVDVACFAQLTSLTHLGIVRFTLELHVPPRFEQLADLPHLQHFALTDCLLYSCTTSGGGDGDADSPLSGLARCHRLTSISLERLHRINMSGAGPARDLSALVALPSLYHLNLRGSSYLTDAVLPHVAASLPASLRTLDLRTALRTTTTTSTTTSTTTTTTNNNNNNGNRIEDVDVDVVDVVDARSKAKPVPGVGFGDEGLAGFVAVWRTRRAATAGPGPAGPGPVVPGPVGLGVVPVSRGGDRRSDPPQLERLEVTAGEGLTKEGCAPLMEVLGTEAWRGGMRIWEEKVAV